MSLGNCNRLNHLQRLLRLCKNNYFQKDTGLKSTDCFTFDGALGTELKRNIVNDWWKTNVIASQELVLGVETTREQHLTCNTIVKPEPFNHGMLLHYVNVLEMTGSKLPFGLANIQNSTGEIGLELENFELIMQNTIPMTLQYFVSPKAAARWFHNLQKQRISWWKKFVGTPSKFTTSVLDEHSHQAVDILCEFPWGIETVERINNFGIAPLQQLEEEIDRLMGKEGKKQVLPCLIETVTSVGTAMATYLFDALRETSKKDETKTILHLHHGLAPFKTALTITSSTTKLQDLANYIVRELRKTGITIYRNDTLNVSQTAALSRFDEMGIPYCIILNDNTLKNGIVGLRNRDTRIKEQVHTTEIRKKLTEYLEMVPM